MAEAVQSLCRRQVFLFGALRSGTTVFRLMLDAHPDISNPGEADFLFDYLSRDDAGHWKYQIDLMREDRIFAAKNLGIKDGLDGLELLDDLLTQLQDKTPGTLVLTVHRHPDRLIQCLPNARFIHLLRDPRDVARSSIGMGWAGNVFFGVDHWIKTETGWDGIAGDLEPQNILELKYEDLFHNVIQSLVTVCDFIGVPFHEKMLTYHEGTTYGPPDAKLTEQWRRKATTREIELVEQKAGVLMKARGYRLEGNGVKVTAAERSRLIVSNKLGVWSFGVRRHGFWVYFMEKVTRWLGLARWNKRLHETISSQSLKYLK